MNNIQIKWQDAQTDCPSINLPLSKSIANRYCVMQALAKKQLLSKDELESEDLIHLKRALSNENERKHLGMSGTAMRFLTAYYSIQEGTFSLLGDARLMERPIKPLVDALKHLGADIAYMNEQGFPPLKINGNQVSGGEVKIAGDISSQFISALLLIAPYTQKGIKIIIEGQLVSRPYIDMTIKLMQKHGINVKQRANSIEVNPGEYIIAEYPEIEVDWSSAAFIYQYFSCSNLRAIQLSHLSFKSIQGDVKVAEYYNDLGVVSEENIDGIILRKTEFNYEFKKFDMIDCPDLIPSFATAASKLLPELEIEGVKTLRIKESNRVNALQIELNKIGVEVTDINENTIRLKRIDDCPKKVNFSSHNDHRIAMSLAIMANENTSVSLENADVVSKSFPDFFKEIIKLGFVIQARN